MPPVRTRTLPRCLLLVLALGAAGAPSAYAEALASRETARSPARASIRFVAARPAERCRATVILASGNLGWTGFTAQLADALAARGCDVVGLDTRAYLTSATRQAGALDPARVPADFLDLLGTAREWRPTQPLFLVGLSEGAGLSILAAADARVGQQLSGVVGLGTPETVTLGWHFWNWTTWVTRREVEEPALSTARYLSFARPVPIAFISAGSGDDIALRAERDLYARAQPPKRLALATVRHRRPRGAGGGVADTIVECLDWARHARVDREAPGRLDPQ